MKAIPVHLTEEQHKKLRKDSYEKNISMASLLRSGYFGIETNPSKSTKGSICIHGFYYDYCEKCKKEVTRMMTKEVKRDSLNKPRGEVHGEDYL